MYKPRHIKFKEIIAIDQWKVKTYTISVKENFDSLITYKNAVSSLSSWLKQLNSFNSNHEFQAFLIVHEATEGVFSIINTWVGNNMLQTHVFFSKYGDSNNFSKISGDGLNACVWELEIMNHERNSWIANILKKDDNPDYKTYLSDTISTRI